MPKPDGRGRCAAVPGLVAGVVERRALRHAHRCPGAVDGQPQNRQHGAKPLGRDRTAFGRGPSSTAEPNDYNPAAHLSVGTSSAPLDDTRTRFNRSHMAGLNNLRKLSEDYQLSSSLTWGYDRLASDRAAGKAGT